MHVDSDLSAYLDAELAPADRARVEAHLTTCDQCRARLNELRATVSLISALPTPRPSRSLVPHVVERFNWLRPLRSFSALASGAFLFLFLATAVARSGSGLGGGPTAPFGGAAAPAAVPRAAATAAPAPAAIQTPAQLPAPVPADAARPGATGTPRAPELLSRPTAPPGTAFQAATPTPLPRAETQPSPAALADKGPREIAGTPSPSPLSDPLLWLGLAVIAAVIAIGAHWRLRRI